MLHKTKGIVLQTIKYSETSIITKIFTRDFGLLSYMINGVRSAKAKNKAALFQPLCMLDLVSYYRENKNLQRLKEYKTAYIYRQLPFDTAKSSVGLFLVEMLSKCLKGEEKNITLFSFIEQSFKFLDETKNVHPAFHLSFLLKMSKHFGFMPSGKFSETTPLFDLREGVFCQCKPGQPELLNSKESEKISCMLHLSFAELGELKLSTKLRKSLLSNIIKFYSYHIEGLGELNSPKILEAVFE